MEMTSVVRHTKWLPWLNYVIFYGTTTDTSCRTSSSENF